MMQNISEFERTKPTQAYAALDSAIAKSVSYTHLTLPTKRIV